MSKKIIIGLLVTVAVGLIAAVITVFANNQDQSSASKSDKVYVATENGGTVDVIDTETRSVTKNIDLSVNSESETIKYMAHNVQVSPDNKSVWVTANAMTGDSHGDDGHDDSGEDSGPDDSGHGNDSHSSEQSAVQDQVIVIDPLKDEIVRRIDIGSGLHLAHVVITPDNQYALAVAQETGQVYKINTSSFDVLGSAKTTEGASPHGLRVAPDGKFAYVAMMAGKSIGKLNLQTMTFEYVPLNGQAVQTAVTPDGEYVATSVFDSKSVAIYNTTTEKIEYAALPEDAKGPLQLYPTPDSDFVYVADQGHEFGQADSNKLHKIDLNTRSIVQTVEVGTAPHGVALSPDGKFTYVTNLVSNDVSIVDNESGKELARVPTSEKPNGISYWSAE